MNSLLQKAVTVNQNGAINGRSIPHSDLTEAERVQLAADAVTATHPYIPTVKVAARDFGTTPAKISAERCCGRCRMPPRRWASLTRSSASCSPGKRTGMRE